MKSKQKNLVATLCASLLSLLGFASCENLLENGLCEYGTPTMDYKLCGTVSDEEGTPLEGIQVTFLYKEYVDSLIGGFDNVVLTDRKGQYQFPEKHECESWAERLVVEDIDGEAGGGSFQSDTVQLNPDVLYQNRGKQYKKGDGSWYQGGYEINVDVTLKKEEKK